jgi:hypothetical protein
MHRGILGWDWLTEPHAGCFVFLPSIFDDCIGPLQATFLLCELYASIQNACEAPFLEKYS